MNDHERLKKILALWHGKARDQMPPEAREAQELWEAVKDGMIALEDLSPSQRVVYRTQEQAMEIAKQSRQQGGNPLLTHPFLNADVGSEKITKDVVDRMGQRLNTDVEGVLKMGGVDGKAAKKLKQGAGALDAQDARKLKTHLAEEVDDAVEGGVPFAALVSAQKHKGYTVVRRAGKWRVQEPNGGLIPASKDKNFSEADALRQAQAINIKKFAPGKKNSRDNFTYGPYQAGAKPPKTLTLI